MLCACRYVGEAPLPGTAETVGGDTRVVSAAPVRDVVDEVTGRQEYTEVRVK